MSPLPGMKVLPDGWSDHHKPAAEGFLTGKCRADRPLPSEDTEWGEEAPEPKINKVWGSAPCSVQILTQSSQPTVTVDSVEVLATHRISTPITPIHLRYKDFFTILDNPDDLVLNGRRFSILVEEKGTTNWTRDYLCQEVNSD